jgi:hypothetical protein
MKFHFPDWLSCISRCLFINFISIWETCTSIFLLIENSVLQFATPFSWFGSLSSMQHFVSKFSRWGSWVPRIWHVSSLVRRILSEDFTALQAFDERWQPRFYRDGGSSSRTRWCRRWTNSAISWSKCWERVSSWWGARWCLLELC